MTPEDVIFTVSVDGKMYRADCTACVMRCSMRGATPHAAAHLLPCTGLSGIGKTIQAFGGTHGSLRRDEAEMLMAELFDEKAERGRDDGR